MLRKRLFILALALCLLALGATAQAPLRGYDKAQGYQYVSFGSYPQGAQGELAPILWRVLQVEGGIAYLMSEYILDVQRVSGDQWNYKGWESSELFAWLNKDFIDKAFSEEEQQALHEDEALGRASLPSAPDLQNKDIGFGTDVSRRIQGTPWALSQRGLYQYSSRNYSPIWMRTPSQQKHAHRSTKSGGAMGFIGVESDDLGVCPVIWLEMDKVSAQGSGSLEAPLVLSPVLGPDLVVSP